MPNATIFEPLSNDTVTAPVTVKAGYTTAANFDMRCHVGSTADTMAHPHTPTSGTHTSTPIPASAATYTVEARDDAASPGAMPLDSQPNVTVTGGTPPTTIDTVTVPPGPLPIVVGGPGAARVKRTRVISGECDPLLPSPVAYVICRIVEIAIKTRARAVIAAGADTVKAVGAKRKWQVQVEFMMDVTDPELQYVARVTAYDKDDVSLGTQTKYFPK
ncbi:MAG TPA: hypothetical protein VM529_04685 [Gemmata sp.]|nr:hypothetical protein [Gemmata sp.]